MWQTLQRILGKLKKFESGRPMRFSGGGGVPSIQPSARGSDSAAVSGASCAGAAPASARAGARAVRTGARSLRMPSPRPREGSWN